MDQIFFGVLGNAAYDRLKGPVKRAWERLTNKTLEDLYIQAFDDAVREIKPFLRSYTDNNEVEINKTALTRVLHQDIALSVNNVPVSEVQDDLFVQRLAKALAAQEVLSLGGHNLSEEGYAQLVRNLIRQSHSLFQQAIVGNEQVFRQVVLEEARKHGLQLDEVRLYLAQQFGVITSKLDALDNRMDEHDATLNQALLNSYEAAVAAKEAVQQELEALKNRQPNIKFGFHQGDDRIVTSQTIFSRSSSLNWQSDEAIEQLVREKISAVEELIRTERAQLSSPRGYADFSGKLVTSEEVDRFEDNCKAYLELYGKALRWYRVRREGQRCQLGFVMYNSGTASATDLEVEICFPEDAYVVSFDDEGKDYPSDVTKQPYPGLPKPQWKRNRDERFMALISNLSRDPIIKPAYPQGPSVDSLDRRRVTYTHPNLRPKEPWFLPLVSCYLHPNTSSFKIEYFIKSNDLPELVAGELTVLLSS